MDEDDVLHAGLQKRVRRHAIRSVVCCHSFTASALAFHTTRQHPSEPLPLVGDLVDVAGEVFDVEARYLMYGGGVEGIREVTVPVNPRIPTPTTRGEPE